MMVTQKTGITDIVGLLAERLLISGFGLELFVMMKGGLM